MHLSRRFLAFVWSGGLLLAGCASLAPPYTRPEPPVPAQFELGAPPLARQAASLPWQDYFADARLQALIAQALDHNRDLRQAAARVAQARAALGIQQAEALPTLAAQAGGQRQRVPGDLNLTGRPVVGNDFQVGLGLGSWELDFWGRVRSLEGAARESFLASEAAQAAARLSLITQVAQADLALRELDERLALANLTVSSRSESLRIFTRRVEVGATSRLALTQVQTLLTQAQALSAQLDLARANQAHALMLLVGGPLDSRTVPLLAATRLAELQPGLPAELLDHRPDLLAAEHQLKAANANIGAARAAFFPRIALTGQAGTASAELNGLFATGSAAWSFAPQITLPLFDGGRREANLAGAQARRDEALARYEATVQGAFRDVNDALAARQGLARQLAIAQQALAAQRERARLSTLRYDAGSAAFLEVLDAQRDLLAAEQQQVQAQRALLSSQVSLYAALGGDAL